MFTSSGWKQIILHPRQFSEYAGADYKSDPTFLDELFKTLGWFCINIYTNHCGKQIVTGLCLTKVLQVTIHGNAQNASAEQEKQ